MKIAYFGTPQFAADVLDYLIAKGVSVSAVVSRVDKAKGRSGTPQPTPVKEVALKHSLPLYQPEKVSSDDFKETLATIDADLFVVVAYGEILKQHVLDQPRLGCINLHASLLPKYRGAAPIQRVIMDGEKESGVSIMYLVKKMDAGDVIATEKVPIGPDMTFGELETSLKEVGSKKLLEVIRQFESGRVTAELQDEALVTFAPKIELEDCVVDWTRSAQEIHNLIRGVNPYPRAWCFVDVGGATKRLKLILSEVAEGEGEAGTILENNREGLVVACGKGAIRLKILQLEGKRAMPADQLMNGIADLTIKL